MQRIALLALAAPKRIIAVAVLIVCCAAVIGLPVFKSLSAAGFRDPAAQSSRAADLLSQEFGQGDLQLVLTVRSEQGASSADARRVGMEIVDTLDGAADVAAVTSPWTAPPPAARGLISTDGKTGLVVAGIDGGGTDAQRRADELAQGLVGTREGVTVSAGGPAMTYVQINHQSKHDLLLVEGIVIPLSFLVLVWVFGGLLAAAVPLTVGIMAIVGCLALLRVITLATEVSTFALNLTAAMGMALAIDYTLLIVSRYRDERRAGSAVDDALVVTMATAGRTVLFSAVTVGCSMLALALFPMYFLRSFAYAGIGVVTLTALAALLVTPAVIVLLGDRIDALDIRRGARRILRRPPPQPQPVERNFWYRAGRFGTRRAVPVAIAAVTLLLVLGAPFLGIKWGFPDDRLLPETASARQIGDQLRNDFAEDTTQAVTIVVPDTAAVPPAEMARYAAELSRVFRVTSVSSPVGAFAQGLDVLGPSGPAGVAGDRAFLTVNSSAPLFSADSELQLAQLSAVAGPGGRETLLTGTAQVNHDNAAAIMSRLPLVLTVMAAITFVLLFLLTGSVVIPIKALVLNALSLTATFGALVWIFQDGHLGALGTTSTGTLVANVPVLLFCIAFGLSMDYEVFLISRIREQRLAYATAGNDEAVALGLAKTGRVVTAAALLMSISFAALIASDVSIMRMFGLGLTLAVVVDATLVRMLLLPAFMHILGDVNWWAPRWMVRLHSRFGLSETKVVKTAGRHRMPANMIGP
ncbi:MMPL family transporter [Mycolicibacterium obuense]|uniref:MMPL family transporter n=1 Tax=Mycolicibacterium obuense TaxID=1807 RepID=UPI000653554E|nr:MMPL family transporter [Mycolicibacterium obuense]